MLWTLRATRNQHHQFCRRATTVAISMSRIFGQKNGSFPCVAFLPPGKSGESSEIEQFDNYNLFVTTQFGKEGSRRIVCHSPGRTPQVQQSTFFLLLLLAAKTWHVLIIMRDTELLENRNMVCKISCSFTHKVFRSIVSLPFINHVWFIIITGAFLSATRHCKCSLQPFFHSN